jgi:acyl-CoA synthetase (AMP-forming)/AMP-acid ligase II
LWKGIQEWTGTRDVCNAYGITETGSWVAGTTVPNVEPEDGLIGEPWGAVVRILKSKSTDDQAAMADSCCAPGESGYVWLNTPALMQGYLGRDDLTAQVVRQGWFVTGDIGFEDDRGLLYLRGREREEINKGGMKIFPTDIDSVVERFEETLDVCTFGYEDRLYGEDVGIALVLKPPQEPNFHNLYSWMGQYLARHQMPSRWFLLDEIPRTSRGKVSRTMVAAKCASLKPLEPRKSS